MCGIVGYVGRREAPEICLDGLRRLEYRGYDSAGIAVVNTAGLEIRRTVGKLDRLAEALADRPLQGQLGIGHTRWATHGKPSVANSHPHLDCRNRIGVVHNGIIENYQELRRHLEAKGHLFRSDTDTEVIAHLVEAHYSGDLRDAVRKAVFELQGAFALGVVASNHSGELVAVRRFSPLVIGLGRGENYIASDMGAIRAETDRVCVIQDDELCRITPDGVEITDLQLRPIHRQIYMIPWSAEAAEKGGHSKFMHKEIHEQAQTLRAGIAARLSGPDAPVAFEDLGITSKEIRSLQRVVFTACGTALHAALVGRFLMDKLARIPAEVELASELRHRDPVVLQNTLCIVVSQSGETADSLEALRTMKSKGARTLGILNVVDSSIARESHGTAYIHAGPEISVAATKTYTSQVLTMILLALRFAEVRGTVTSSELPEIKQALLAVPDQVEQLLAREEEVRSIAKRHFQHPSALYLARGINLASAMEGALKLKEISYIHAEAYSAGEMKHGPIALVCPEMFVVALALRGPTYHEMIANIMEVKARSGSVVALAYDGDAGIASVGAEDRGDRNGSSANDVLWIPPTHEYISPVTSAVPLQLLAYHIADLRGEHIDQPRNLAKTVTVK